MTGHLIFTVESFYFWLRTSKVTFETRLFYFIRRPIKLFPLHVEHSVMITRYVQEVVNVEDTYPTLPRVGI